jgi:hypothetical protein
MKRLLFIFAVFIALGLTYSGAEALVYQVNAADGLKSSVITFVLTLGYALLGPAFLSAAVFFHRKSDSRAQPLEPVPATPKEVYRPYLHGH